MGIDLALYTINEEEDRMSRKFLAVFMSLALLTFMIVPSSAAFAGSGKGKGNGKATLNNFQPELHLQNSKLLKNKKKIAPGLLKKYKANEEGNYIIIFNGPIEDEMKAESIKRGAELIEYIPDFAFLAKMSPEEAKSVEELGFVKETRVYQPVNKFQSALLDEYGNVKGYGEGIFNVVTFGKDKKGFDRVLKNSRGKKLGHKKNKTIVKLNRGQLKKLARLDDVKYIEEKPTYELFNDVATDYIDVDQIWNLGYKGSGQVVGVCDTGLDSGVNDSSMHADFQGRIDDIFALGRSTADDPHGHGTHVAGSVLGDGTESNGEITGIAPEANLVFQSVLDSNGGLGGLPTDLNDLFVQAKNAGSDIHTNSWGASVNGDYNTNAREVDEYLWNNNDMIILFAASNDGDDEQGNVVYNTIGSPGTAKNCITVGASENYRPSKGSYADDPTDIALFSSRGNTDDGRTKPDIVAPGTWILSTRSSLASDDSFWGTYNNYYAFMGGTSMATPITAGAVASAREFMQTEWNHTPSPAMMKAALINGATDLGFGVPSKDQGWGRISLNDSFNSKEYKYEDETYSLSTNETKTFNYDVESTNTPLRLSVVWTDYPGSTTATKALVNDLDLVVTSPSGTVYNGNDFSSPYNDSADHTNNVENVWIETPETGTYTVTIEGYNVPQGPQPFVLFASADFGTSSGGGTDTTAPSVSISNPSASATVSSSVSFAATASDNVGVSKVEFYVDNSLVATDTSSPYSTSWDTTAYTDGNHNLEVIAYDAAGNTNSDSISVTVDNSSSGGGTSDTASETFSGYVDSSGTASQYFYIDVTSTGTVDLSLTWGTSDDLDMFLYDPSGSEVARAYTTSDPETISFDATTTGRYKIEVNAYSGANSFTVDATHPIDTAQTSVGQATDTLSDGANKEYTITVGDSGTLNVSLSWTNSSSSDLDIYLLDPSGSQVDKAYSTRNPESISYKVSTTGDYTIKVDSYSGSADFTLDVVWPK